MALGMTDINEGTGTMAVSGKQVSVHYTGTLTDGHVFDSSRAREPFTFTTGARMVIEGFERGVRGMRVGGRRRLTIPPSLGYGDRGHPPAIPERATLVFDLELLAVN
jgi:FKBP-type peptidyl-prolyl cis-trans isomerase